MNIAIVGVGIIEHTNLIGSENYNNSHIFYICNYLSKDDKEYHMNETELIDEYEQHLKMAFPHFEKSLIKSAHLFRDNFAQPVIEVGYQNKILPHSTPLKNVYLANMSQIYPENRGINQSIRLLKKIKDFILTQSRPRRRPS